MSESRAPRVIGSACVSREGGAHGCGESGHASIGSACGRAERECASRQPGRRAGGGAPRALINADRCSDSPRCPKCGNDDRSMIEATPNSTSFCNVCAHEWGDHSRSAGLTEADGQHLSMLAGPHLRSLRALAGLAKAATLARGPQALGLASARAAGLWTLAPALPLLTSSCTHRSAPRRAGDARRDRGTQRIRSRSPQCALADRTGDSILG